MSMKISRIFFLIILFTGLTTSITRAQQAPIESPQNPPIEAPNQCNDKKDNDGDGLIDSNGFGTTKADPQCTTGVKCEDGTTKCITAAGSGDGAGVGTANGNELALKVVINNPLKVATIQEAIKLFMDAVLKIAIPFIVIFFIWSGLSFVLARGNPEKIKTAKNMFLYTIIGTLLILGAWTITNAIIGTVNSITG